MATDERATHRISLLDVVALLVDRPEDDLTRGQVGTVVEDLDHSTVLVDFSDDHGQTYAIVPCLKQNLLVLHYIRETA